MKEVESRGKNATGKINEIVQETDDGHTLGSGEKQENSRYILKADPVECVDCQIWRMR